MKMSGKYGDAMSMGKYFNLKLNTWGKEHLGEHDVEKQVDPNGKALALYRECSVYTLCRFRTDADESLQTRKTRKSMSGFF